MQRCQCLTTTASGFYLQIFSFNCTFTPNFCSDMSETPDLKSDATEKKDRDFIPNILSSASLGLGVMATLAPFSVALGLNPTIAFGSRLAVSMGASALLHTFNNRILKGFSGKTFKELLHDGEKEELVRRTIYTGVNSIATFGVLPFLAVGAWDYMENRSLEEQLKLISDQLHAYETEPSSLPGMVEVNSNLLRDVGNDLAVDGSMTPESAAKLALFFDGAQIEQDSERFTLGACEKTWPINDSATTNGLVCYRSPDNWMLISGEHSWWMGPEAEGPKVQDFMKVQFPNSIKTKAVETSQRINDIPVETEILEEAQPDLKSVHFETIDSLKPLAESELKWFFPIERNVHGRALLSDAAKSRRTSVLAETAKDLQDAKERLLTRNEDDPHSYASVLALINKK